MFVSDVISTKHSFLVVWAKGMMCECCLVHGLLILYEFIVKLEISTFCSCM